MVDVYTFIIVRAWQGKGQLSGGFNVRKATGLRLEGY